MVAAILGRLREAVGHQRQLKGHLPVMRNENIKK